MICSEEYVDKYGIRDMDMNFFLFKTGEIKDEMVIINGKEEKRETTNN